MVNRFGLFLHNTCSSFLPSFLPSIYPYLYPYCTFVFTIILPLFLPLLCFLPSFLPSIVSYQANRENIFLPLFYFCFYRYFTFVFPKEFLLGSQLTSVPEVYLRRVIPGIWPSRGPKYPEEVAKVQHLIINMYRYMLIIRWW